MFPRWFLLLALLLTVACPVVGQTSPSDTRTRDRSYVRMFQFSPDSKTVVIHTIDGTLRSWDLASRKLKQSRQAHADYVGVPSLAFDPQGNLLSVDEAEGGIRLMDGVSKKEVKFLEIPDFTYLDEFAFSPDGKILAFTEGRASDVIKLWDLTTGKEKAAIQLSNSRDDLRAMLFSNDGATLAGLSHSSTTLWSTATGRQMSLIKINAGLRTNGFHARREKDLCQWVRQHKTDLYQMFWSVVGT